jgi:hypothetical protein
MEEEMKRLRLIQLLFLLPIIAIGLLLGCEGSQGPLGDAGDQGTKGRDGEDWSLAPPDDAIFSIAVFNGRADAHNGNATVLLTADETAGLDGSKVLMDSVISPPVIDGVDDGDGVWGAPLSRVDLSRSGAPDVFIDTVWMRFAYDNDYVYMLVRWREVAAEGSHGFSVSENKTCGTLSVDSSTDDKSTPDLDEVLWTKSSDVDDRLSLFWLLQARFEDRVNWQTEGCRIACHAELGGGMFTPSDTTRLDVWEWGSVLSNYNGFAVDARLASGPQPNGLWHDLGSPVYLANDLIEETVGSGTSARDVTHPRFVHKLDPDFDAAYPFWEWEAQGYQVFGPKDIVGVDSLDWEVGSTVPGIVAGIPSFSAADILAKGRFQDGTWTVEFQRLRVTGHSEDIEF